MLKTIKLLPTSWSVDIWLYEKKGELAKKFHKRYGASIEHYEEEYLQDAVFVLSSTKKSELKGVSQIVCIVTDKREKVLLHELNHVVYSLFFQIGISDYPTNQEWHSYYLEYLFEEVKKILKK